MESSLNDSIKPSKDTGTDILTCRLNYSCQKATKLGSYQKIHKYVLMMIPEATEALFRWWHILIHHWHQRYSKGCVSSEWMACLHKKKNMNAIVFEYNTENLHNSHHLCLCFMKTSVLWRHTNTMESEIYIFFQNLNVLPVRIWLLWFLFHLLKLNIEMSSFGASAM